MKAELPLSDDRIYNPLSTQVGGAHYKGQGIQPVEFLERNHFPFSAACAIKYVFRWKLKNGKEDLQKAHHFLELGELFHTPPLARHHAWVITPDDFLSSNSIGVPEYQIILAICATFEQGKKAYQKARKLITELLNTL